MPNKGFLHSASNLLCDVGFTSKRRLNSLKQLRGRRFLQNVPRRARLHSLHCKFGILVHGQENEFDAGHLLLESAAGLQPIQQWHSNISHNHIRLEGCGGIQECATIGNGRHNLIVRSNKVMQSLSDKGVVIG